MKRIGQMALIACLTAALSSSAAAGPYSQSAGDPSNAWDPGVPGFVGPDGDGQWTTNNYVNPDFLAWATEVVDYSPAPGLDAIWTDPQKALGPTTGSQIDVVSLGDPDASQIAAGVSPGQITLRLGSPARDGAGPDFAVFENGMPNLATGSFFGELAYVEVSTDGATFARFPSVSLTPSPVGAVEEAPHYGCIDPTDVYNLAGKHANGYDAVYGYSLSWATPFDLADLAGLDDVVGGAVDLTEINYVRIVDIPGSGDFRDAAPVADAGIYAEDHPIYDAWVTTGSGGFDLEAVGVLNVPEPASAALLAMGAAALIARRRAPEGA